MKPAPGSFPDMIHQTLQGRRNIRIRVGKLGGFLQDCAQGSAADRRERRDDPKAFRRGHAKRKDIGTLVRSVGLELFRRHITNRTPLPGADQYDSPRRYHCLFLVTSISMSFAKPKSGFSHDHRWL